MKALLEGGEVIEPLRDRILGRVAAIDLVNPETQETAITAGTLLDEDTVEYIDSIGVDEAKVRTPLTLDTRPRLFPHCHHTALGRGRLDNRREAAVWLLAHALRQQGHHRTHH